MGRKADRKERKGGRRRGDDDEEGNDGIEGGVCPAMDSDEEEVAVSSITDLLIDAVDKLEEKRSSTRVAGLTAIVKVLRSPSLDEECLQSFIGYRETITPWLKKGLKSSTTDKEGVLCAQLVCLLALALGPDEDDFVEEFAKSLSICVRSASSERFRVWCMVARAFISFVCATAAKSTLDVLTFCEEIITDRDDFDGTDITDELLATALHMWAVTAAYLGDPAAVLARSRDVVFEGCIDIMDDDQRDPSAKIAAGECLALLWEVAEEAYLSGETGTKRYVSAANTHKPTVFDEVCDEAEAEAAAEAAADAANGAMNSDSNDHRNGTTKMPNDSSKADSRTANSVFGFAADESTKDEEDDESWVSQFIEVDGSTEGLGQLIAPDEDTVFRALHLLRETARESSKHISKKNRKEIRSGFRSLEEWVIDGAAPSETVTFNGAVVTCTCFAEIRRLDLLRVVVADGLPAVLRNFEVACDLLEVDGGDLSEHVGAGKGVRSIVDKGSDTAKVRAKTRRAGRQARSAEQSSGWGSD